MQGEQQSFKYRGRGGRRDGAGRPRTRDPGVTHDARPPLAARYPVHVTLRALPGIPNLRRAGVYAVIEAALRALLVRTDFRIVQFCVQTNHLHLLVEAHEAEALSRGVQALAIRIARGVNRAARHRGKVWRGRYHARVLRSPREVRHALCYVLQNTRHHETTEREIVDPYWIDPRSSGPWFDGWRSVPGGSAPPAEECPTAESQTWLLSQGWRRHGLIRVDEVPSAAFP
jgi:REP element-mobilizing transposase RayT